MRRAFFGGAPAFVVNLGGGDVAVAEEFLDLADIDAGIEEQGSSGGAQGMGAVEPRAFLDRPGQLRHVAGDDSIHAGLAHGLVTKLIAVDARAEPGKSVRPASPAFARYSASASAAAKWMPMVRCLLPFSLMVRVASLAVLMKVLDPQPAGGGKPDAGVEVGFEDGAVAEIQHVVTGGKTHQLTGAGGGERPGAFQRVGRFAGDELGVGRIGDVDRAAAVRRRRRPGTCRSSRARRCGG